MPIALNRRWSVATLSLAVAAASCTSPTETSPGLYAYLGILPSLSQDAIEVYRGIDDFGFRVNNVRVAITRQDGSLMYDSTIAVAPGQDSLVLELLVPMRVSNELVAAVVELRDSSLVVFSGMEPVELRQGGGARAIAPIILLDYTGPGALARVIDMSPGDTAITPKSTVSFTAGARDAYGASLSNVPVSWSLSDATAGEIDNAGTFRPRGRGQTWVIARLPTGLRDSVQVTVGR